MPLHRDRRATPQSGKSGPPFGSCCADPREGLKKPSLSGGPGGGLHLTSWLLPESLEPVSEASGERGLSLRAFGVLRGDVS